jgi:penicillin-binding protein 2
MQRSIAFYIAIAMVILVFTGRLFSVQILNDDYAARAERNATAAEKLYAPRGYIYDRNGELMVGNSPAYDLMVSPYQIKDLDTIALGNLLGLEVSDIKERLIKAKHYSYFRSSMFMKMLSKEEYTKISTELSAFPGFHSQKRILRNYPMHGAGNVVGYIGEVTTEFIKANPGYSQGDLAGKSGIDKSYEEYLKGTHGKRYFTVDHRNRKLGPWKDGAFDELPIPGMDIVSSIDLELQLYGEKLMRGKRGSIVAIEPSTGEILAMVSSPSYDPNELVGRVRSKNYMRLYNDSINKPLFDRGILAEYPPGSPFKLIGALVALQEGVIQPSTRYSCHHGYHYGSLTVACHCRGGSMDLRQAISESCNNYFCTIYQKTIDGTGNSAEGMQRWSDHVKSFGLGKFLGNDLPTGRKGLIPDAAWYDRFIGRSRWKGSNSVSNGIGQGELVVTPIQLANMAAAIGNRGYYYTPHVVKEIKGDASIDSTFTIPHHTTIDPIHFNTVIEGMHDVFESGTAKASRLEHLSQCGKTGTAQNPHGQDHSIFVSFAPKDEPKIAIAVIIENGYWGSRWAAPIASLMMESYITDTITRPLLEQRMFEGSLHEEYRKEHIAIYGEDTTYNPNF